MRKALALLLFFVSWPVFAWQAGGPYPFGVLNQHSVSLTAEYWNPILRYVSQKSGVSLKLKISASANQTTDLANRNALAFVYSNHFFTPARQKLGFHVFARANDAGIRGVIAVREDSLVRDLEQLRDRRIAFPNPYAFVGYHLPMDALTARDIRVSPVFSANQEAAISLLRHVRIDAIGANESILESYARRSGLRYRVIWRSAPYPDLALMAHGSLAPGLIARVQQAFVNMKRDPEGRKILLEASRRIGERSHPGFITASDADYAGYLEFFRRTRVPHD
jgi:phosphonate transport system substrate-binding protein